MEMNFNLLDETPTELMQEIKSDNIPTEQITGNTDTGLNDFNNNNYQQNNFGNGAQEQQNQSQNLNAGSLITPEIAVSIIDTIIPVLFVLIFKRFHNKNINKKSVSLTNSEKDTIKPVLQNYLNSINFSVEKPIDALIITFGFIYGMKYIEIQNDTPTGNFKTSTPPSNIGEPTARGTIKIDGRGRPKGTTKKQPKQII